MHLTPVQRVAKNALFVAPFEDGNQLICIAFSQFLLFQRTKLLERFFKLDYKCVHSSFCGHLQPRAPKGYCGLAKIYLVFCIYFLFLVFSIYLTTLYCIVQ